MAKLPNDGIVEICDGEQKILHAVYEKEPPRNYGAAVCGRGLRYRCRYGNAITQAQDHSDMSFVRAAGFRSRWRSRCQVSDILTSDAGGFSRQ
jgi:hypothetical protein